MQLPPTPHSLGRLRLSSLRLFALLAVLGVVGALPAQDTRFDDTVFASGLDRPSDLEFSADGRLFFVEQAGLIKVFPSLTATTPIVVADLRSSVGVSIDAGMHGLAVHPLFPAQPYLYVSHAIAGGLDPAGRLLRLTIDPATNLEIPGARITLLEGWCRRSTSDGIRALDDVVFGPDGALYLSGGDWGDTGDYTGSGACPDPIGAGGAFRSQDRATPGDPFDFNGSVIRVDPLSGAPMPGNPLDASPDADLRYIIADGLRSPFRMTTQPGTESLWIGDVGEGSFEEINKIEDVNDAVIENFGHPCFEGVNPHAPGQASNPTICNSITVTPPVKHYAHGQPAFIGDACSPGVGGSSVSALGFYPGGDYPAEYFGALFVGDYSRNCIWAMLPDASGNPDPTNMVTVLDAAAGPADLVAGPDGDMFYSDVVGGTIRRLEANSNEPPPPPDGPVNIAPGKPAQQSSSWDNLGPENAVDLLLDGAEQQVSHTEEDFQAWWQVDLQEVKEIDEVVLWNRTDCCQDRLSNFHVLVSDTPFASFDLQATINQPGVTDFPFPGSAGRETRFAVQRTGRYVRVQLAGTNFLQLAEVEVFHDPNGSAAPPTVSIDSPTSSLIWVTGSPIAFSGSATSALGAALPGSALDWAILLNHCIGSTATCHQHQLTAVNGAASGSVPGPDHGYPASVELRLTATDPDTGASASTSVTLQPQTVILTFDTSPTGLQLLAGESAELQTTPFTGEFIIGSTANMIGPIEQSLGGTDFTFESWSDGGSRVHTVPAPPAPTTYTATYAPPAPVNQPPVPTNPGPQSTVEGAAVSLFILATDPEEDVLTFSAGGLPTGLGINPNTGEISGSPAPDSAGPYAVTVSVSDGLEVVDVPFGWTITAPANQDPTADPQLLTTAFETPLPIVLTGSDPDLDPLTFAIVTPPAGGVLSGTAPNVTYTPNTAFSGPDSFTFSVDDGRSGIVQAVVSITVGSPPANLPPPAEGINILAATEQWQTIALTKTYVSPVVVCTAEYGAGSPPLVTRIRNAAPTSFELRLGRFDGSTSAVIPTPARCFAIETGVYNTSAHGVKLEAVQFNSTITDSSGSWTGLARSYANAYSNPIVIGQVMTANDANPSVFWSRGPNYGTAPNATKLFVGKTVSEDPNTARANETIGYIVMEAGSNTIGSLPVEAGLKSDVRGHGDAPPYFATIAGNPSGAVLSGATMAGANGGWPILYGPGAVAPQQLRMAWDEDQINDIERVHISERVAYVAWTDPAGGNQQPTADPRTLSTAFQTPLPIVLTGSDPDLDPLALAIVTPPTNGALSGTAPNVTYTPNAGFSGPDSFTFSVNDGRGGTAQAVVSITVGANPNQIPTAVPQTLTTAFQTALPIVLTGSDPDFDPLTFAIVNPPLGGSLSGAAPNVIYTPGPAFSGPDVFTFSVNDGRGGGSQAAVSVTVGAPPNQLPTAQPQSLTASAATALPIVLTGSDPDLDPLTFAIVSHPGGGVLSGVAPNVTFMPSAGFLGPDSFTFSVSDGRGGIGQAVISLTISAAQGSLKAEVVAVSGISSTQWLPVALTKTYVSPVIVCSPVYAKTDPASVVRMRGAASTGFEVRAVRLSSGSQPIASMDAQCLVVEEGLYTTAVNGVRMEAVRYQSTVTDARNSWTGESRSYLGSYSSPVVLGQVMTANDASWSTFWARGGSVTTAPSAGALFTGKHVAEDPNTVRAAETVGYIVIESGAGTLDGLNFQAAVGGASVLGRANNPPFSYSIPLAGANAAVVSAAGMAGSDGGWPVLLAPYPIDGGSLDLMFDEDQLSDGETWHTRERVAYVVFALP